VLVVMMVMMAVVAVVAAVAARRREQWLFSSVSGMREERAARQHS
jgi:hypothetical protein